MRSRRCDCGEQLERVLQLISEECRGAVVYLCQEGRDIGYLVDIVKIENKLNALVDYYRDKLLNDLPEFTSVRLWESKTCWAAWRQEY